jgi:hypothetical protein
MKENKMQMYDSNSHSLYTLVIENTLFKIVDYLLIANFLKQLILKNWKFWNAFLLYVWRLIFPFCFMIINNTVNMLFYNKNKNKLKSLKNVHIKTKQENGNET